MLIKCRFLRNERFTGAKKPIGSIFSLVSILFLFVFLPFCGKANEQRLETNDYTLVGSALSEIDRKSGVTQASPGITETLGVIPANQNLLRFKIYDEPIPDANKGLLQFVIEYDSIQSLIFAPPVPSGIEPSSVTLYVDRIEVTNQADGSLVTVNLPGKDSRIVIKNGRHYIPIVRGITLLPGNYENLKVWLKDEGNIISSDTEFGVRIRKRHVDYQSSFEVKKRKITTLHAVPVREYGGDKKGVRSAREIASPDYIYKISSLKYNVQLNVKGVGYALSDSIDQIFVRFLRLNAVAADGAQYLLNDTPTEFELLSLREGAVALMGNNMIPEGEYASFDLTLGDDKHRVIVGGNEYPIIVEDRIFDTLRFMGPFDLRGGRITEVFLHFDPNTSVFFLPERGYVLDPDIFTTSVVSMTRSQNLRLIDALGQRSNLVVSESEIIFQGSVKSLETIVAKSSLGRKAVYSDMKLEVRDRLRGRINDPSNFPLRVIGGEYDGLKLTVSGMPEFEVGEADFLLFLRKFGDRYGVVRGEWGKVSL